MDKDLLVEKELEEDENEDLEQGVEVVEEPTDHEGSESSQDLERELEELRDKYVRLQAEYSNYRRRTDEEKSKIYSLGNERLILELLPILDNFDRAICNMKENNLSKDFLDGVDMIKKSLIQVLDKEGLKYIEACGQEFDPNYHHAVLMEECQDTESGLVLEELQKGYKLKDKTIRPTMVKVSK